MEPVKDWFSGSWEVKTESDILLPGGKSIRPDRVMIKDKTAIIADYKTGKKSEEYKAQIEGYAAALREAGYEQVDKYIIYLDETEIIKL
jgi:CRISPR/Cas system-associated exonuclease Cas4 (RecB family)